MRWLTNAFSLSGRRGVAGEVDEALLDVGVDELDVDAVADFQAGVAADEFAFDGWLKDADPGAFFGGAGDEAVVLVAELAGEEEGGGGFLDREIDFGGVVLVGGAVGGEGVQFGGGVGEGGALNQLTALACCKPVSPPVGVQTLWGRCTQAVDLG